MARRIAAAAFALTVLTGCAGVAHRVYVATLVGRYIRAHGGSAHDYKMYHSEAASMLPTIPIGADVLVNLAAYKGAKLPARGDLTVFWPPLHEKDPFIKRIVALPGDTLDIHSGILYVNGHAVAEPYVKERADYGLAVRNYRIEVSEDAPASALGWPAYVPKKPSWSAPDRLPPNCYFVLGDNRNDSEDSHIFGCIKRSDFIGKIVAVYR